MARRVVLLALAALFLAGAALQLNDPDPLPWLALYLAAAALTGAGAMGRPAPGWACLATAAIALAWGAWLLPGWFGRVAVNDLFAAFEMESQAIELARESLGLFLVAGVLIAIARAPAPRG